MFLKTMSPRVAKGIVSRERLRWANLQRQARQVICLLAPTGYGKTSQLVQWRREASANGVLTIWYSFDSNDQPLRLMRGLTLAAQAACGSFGFSEPVVETIESSSDPSLSMTTWLAEIAYISADILLILDDVEQLPASVLTQVLPYLLRNAPANLHIALSSQPSGALVASGVLAPGSVTLLNASDLRFRLNETLEVLNSLLGQDCKPEVAAHLHELTEGWPFGVQLVAAALHQGNVPAPLVETASQDLRRYFVDTVINRQSDATIDMLVRLSQLELVHPDLCQFVLQKNGIEAQLQHLLMETPLLNKGENEDWMRIHAFAKKILRERLAHISLAERQQISSRASHWFARHEMFEQAAEQAFLAGDSSTALTMIERSMEEMTVQGRSTAVLSWYERMSADEIRQHSTFWAPVAWALAMSEKHEQASIFVNMILGQPELSTKSRFEASLITATAASFADRLDLMTEAMEPWPQAPEGASLGHIPIYTTVMSLLAIYRGDPEHARLLINNTRHFDYQKVYSPVTFGFNEFCEGLSYIWSGQYTLAEQHLRPALARAEPKLGRRNFVTCMLASLLAQACWEVGKQDEPSLLLADRITILERQGNPSSLITAYRLQARLADAQGRQDQALNALDSLYAIGRARNLIRLKALALYEMVKLHARHARAETARSVANELKALVAEAKQTHQGMIYEWLQLHLQMALASSELALDTSTSNPAAKTHAEQAAKLALKLKRSGDFVQSRLLLADALERLDAGKNQSVLAEAYSFAEANGMKRIIEEYEAGKVFRPKKQTPLPQQKTTDSVKDDAVQIIDNALLTPKEQEVLLLLSRSFSNKEIAHAMNIGIETVKWHIKNLSGKLHAGNRKHAVARARMLGLFKE